MARQGPNHQLPGPAALRFHAEKRRPPFLLVEKRAPPRTLRAHMAGEYAPSGPWLVAYKVLLGIPMHGFFTPAELEAVGVGPDGKRLEEKNCEGGEA